MMADSMVDSADSLVVLRVVSKACLMVDLAGLLVDQKVEMKA